MVLAPGAFGSGLLEPWLPRANLRPVKGQLLRLRTAADAPLARHVIRTPNVYIVPRTSGEVIVGASVEDAGFDRRATAAGVNELLERGRRVLPGIADLEFAEVSVGFRPAFEDHLPAIGAVANGLFVAAGHFRTGVALAPVTARLVADLVTEGRADPLLAAFDPTRFASAARTTRST